MLFYKLSQFQFGGKGQGKEGWEGKWQRDDREKTPVEKEGS